MLGYLFGNYNGVYGIGMGNYYTPPATPITKGIGPGQFQMLQNRVDSLELACAALWRLLKEQNGFTDEQLKSVIHDVDAADGTVDGRVTPQGGDCPHCHHRVLSRTAGKCLWCGAPLNGGPFSQSDSESSP
jgi:hypothetical protein